MYTELAKIIAFLSDKTGIDLACYEANLPHTIQIQN